MKHYKIGKIVILGRNPNFKKIHIFLEIFNNIEFNIKVGINDIMYITKIDTYKMILKLWFWKCDSSFFLG